MKRKVLTLVVAGIMALSASMTALAGQWKEDTSGWWYQNDDASYLKDGWNWVDGKCYYFTAEGYCLLNTTTPDGYQVDGSGAWIVDGVIQTQAPAESSPQNVYQVDTLSFTLPDGFAFDSTEEGNSYFVSHNGKAVIVVSSEAMNEWGELEIALGAAIQEPLLNAAIEMTFGVPSSRVPKQYSSGVWYRYEFSSGTLMGIPGSMVANARIHGNRVQMVAFAGDLTGVDVDGIMNQNLK